jgi:hypothetical protein
MCSRIIAYGKKRIKSYQNVLETEKEIILLKVKNANRRLP